jgi:viroplasmin and RNaseH domain-containing protein
MSHLFYVVFDGHEPGVYYNWPDCHRQVHMFHGACYKKYNSYEEGIAAFKSRTNSNPALAHDDDFYLQNPTTTPPSSSFKNLVIVVLLIFVCLLWKKL